MDLVENKLFHIIRVQPYAYSTFYLTNRIQSFKILINDRKPAIWSTLFQNCVNSLEMNWLVSCPCFWSLRCHDRLSTLSRDYDWNSFRRASFYQLRIRVYCHNLQITCTRERHHGFILFVHVFQSHSYQKMYCLKSK